MLGLGRASPQKMWISKDEYELFESVEPTLPGVRECAELAERQDAKWRWFWPPLSGGGAQPITSVKHKLYAQDTEQKHGKQGPNSLGVLCCFVFPMFFACLFSFSFLSASLSSGSIASRYLLTYDFFEPWPFILLFSPLPDQNFVLFSLSRHNVHSFLPSLGGLRRGSHTASRELKCAHLREDPQEKNE